MISERHCELFLFEYCGCSALHRCQSFWCWLRRFVQGPWLPSIAQMLAADVS